MGFGDALEDFLYLVELRLNVEADVQLGGAVLDDKYFPWRGAALADVFVDAVEEDFLHVGLELALPHVEVVAVEGGEVPAGVGAVRDDVFAVVLTVLGSFDTQ
jgi:hypothetical protein